MKKILIIHTWGIGDMIMFSPLLEHIKKQWQDCSIDFFITQRNSIIPLKNSDYVHQIIHSELNPISLIKAIRNLRKSKYDICFHTSGISPLKIFIFSIFIRYKKMFGEYRLLKNPLFTDQVRYSSNNHRYESNLNIVRLFMNTSEVKPQPTFYLSNDDKCFADEYLHNNNLHDKIIFGIHPGCNKKAKNRRWDKKSFVEVINYLKNKYPKIVFLMFIGPDEEEDGFYIEKHTSIKTIRNKSLTQTASLIAKCNYFLNTDSGLGHIASCFDPYIFTIFGPADSTLTRPLSEKTTVIKKNLKCQPCEQQNPHKCGVKCLTDLKPDQVSNEIEKKLSLLR